MQDKMIWVRAQKGTDELNDSQHGLFRAHDNGLFLIPESMLPALEHTGGCAKVSDSDALATPAAEPASPVSIEDVLAVARKMPVGTERSVLVNKIAEAALTTPRSMVLAQVTPGTTDFVHAGERFEIGSGGYVFTTPEAAEAAGFNIVGAVVRATA